MLNKSAVVLLLLCVLLPVGHGQPPRKIKVQGLIEQGEKSIRSRQEKSISGAADARVATREIRYPVTPEAIEAAAWSSLVSVGYQNENDDFIPLALGFAAAPSGFIITVSGALDAANDPVVSDASGNLTSVKIVSRDELTQYVLLKSPQDHYYLPFGVPGSLVSGQQFSALVPTRNSSWGTRESPNKVSAIPCSIAPPTVTSALELPPGGAVTDLLLSHSYTGAPVLDAYGDVVGTYVGQIRAKGSSQQQQALPEGSEIQQISYGLVLDIKQAIRLVKSFSEF